MSYQKNDIHWYRLVDNQVIQTIYFVTRHSSLPAFLEIYYGTTPLFIPPVFQKSPYFYKLPCEEQMSHLIPETIPNSTYRGYETLLIHGMLNRPYREPDVLIMCPRDKHDGLDVLEKVFALLDTIKTPADCYRLHKKYRQHQLDHSDYPEVSPFFVEEVLFWEDEEMYSPCQRLICDWLLRTDREQRLTNDLQNKRDSYVILKEVIEKGKRQEYLQCLDERIRKTIRQLERFTTIRGNA